MELTSDLKDMSEGEDVFYTYRASVGSSRDSDGDPSPHQLVPDTDPHPPLLLPQFTWLRYQDVRFYLLYFRYRNVKNQVTHRSVQNDGCSQ